MIKILSRFAVFMVIGIIGYLTYTSLKGSALSMAAEGKELPVITKKMISPVYVEPEKRASPVDRDPFSVGWDRYVALSASDGNENIADAPVGDVNNVRFPDELMGILTGADGQKLALIGSEVCGIGSLVKQTDSNRLWQVSSIGDESVVLTCNGSRAVLKIPNVDADYNDVQENISKNQQQKEPAQ
jgi:hypothetical protein